MIFTGDVNDRCAISFALVKELDHPVGFEPMHAYDCDSLIEWLRVRPTNPITAQEIARDSFVIDVLQPLVVQENRGHLESTRAKLERAGKVCEVTGQNTSGVFPALMALVHTIFYTYFTVYASFQSSEHPLTVFGAGLTLMSFAWFLRDSKLHNGQFVWVSCIILLKVLPLTHPIQVALFVYFLVELTGLGMYTIVKIMIWHSAMLAMRFLFLCGATTLD